MHALRILRTGFGLSLTLLLLAGLRPVAAADAAPGSPGARPRIGLVLGGGGAKGGAHIGVLKVLEEMRIPVDCIAGTSMGAIVGAAYAAGLPADQLAEVVSDVKWRDVLKSAPREGYPMRRKGLDFIFTNGFEVGVKDGDIVLPGAFVPTQQIEELFRRIVSRARQTSDFNKLPIPFRAVATDLESGQVMVFDHGDLAVAMRASMAVPGAFAPVEYNGRLYVDGMLVRNLPVDVARKLCADVVIAVPVGNPAATRDNLQGALKVLGQAMNIAIESNEKAQLATLTSRDVEIPVILVGITSGDFNKVPEAIPIGEAAARKAAASLARYSLPPKEYAEWRSDLHQLAAVRSVVIDEVRIEGAKLTNPEVMKTHLVTKPGDSYDPDKADADSTNLVERGDFTAVSSHMITENGRNVLVYDVTEKPYGPDYLKFDGNLSTDFKGDTYWGLRVDYEKRLLNDLGGEARVAAQLGHPNAFLAEFYQPVEKTQTFFVAPSVYANQILQYVYRANNEVGQFDVRRYGGRIEAGAVLGSWGEARIGLLRGRVDTRKTLGDDSVQPSGGNDAGAATFRFAYDQLDQRLYPTRGGSASILGYYSSTGLGADQSYKFLNAQFLKVQSFGRNVFTAVARGGTDFNSNVPLYDQFKLGGMFQFSGYRTAQLVGREYALGTVQYRRRIGDLNETLGTGIYAGGTLEAGNVWQRADGTSAKGVIFSGSAFLGIDSKLGPVYFAYGRSEGGRSAFYLYIGSAIEAF
jgi:NTE family protein